MSSGRGGARSSAGSRQKAAAGGAVGSGGARSVGTGCAGTGSGLGAPTGAMLLMDGTHLGHSAGDSGSGGPWGWLGGGCSRGEPLGASVREDTGLGHCGCPLPSPCCSGDLWGSAEIR